MAFDPISAVFGIADTVIKRVWPNPEDQAKAQIELAKLQQEGSFKELDAQVQVLMGQIETNKIEAEHGGLFKGGWRPAVGWVCAAAMAYTFILNPMIVSAVQIIAHFTGAELFPLEFLPDLGWQDLSPVLIGMLGLGGLRTFEKRQSRIQNTQQPK
jgi:hypothetical protein